MTWTTRELEILQTTSRVTSAFSLVGAGFIIITFCTSKSFHRPINRLAFFATFGNILTNAATITSRDGIRAGQNSALCQAQAMIIQWSIPADALFCLAMAWNVYLTVFKKKTTRQLKCLEPYYVAGCYGIPLSVAIIFLFIKKEGKGRIYGPATLWCWVSEDWQVLRIATFYGPVWVVLTITFFIYVCAGRIIFNLRRNLRRFINANPTTSKPALEACDAIELSMVADAKCGTVRDPPSAAPDTAYSCTISAQGRTGVAAPAIPSTHNTGRKKNNPAMEANTAAWAYCRCAMLFFLALVITWLPSSINRVYTVRYPDATDFGLNFAAALVLPAQGFWNGLIYIITTLPACKEYMKSFWKFVRRPFNWSDKRRRRSNEFDMDILGSWDSSMGGVR